MLHAAWLMLCTSWLLVHGVWLMVHAGPEGALAYAARLVVT